MNYRPEIDGLRAIAVLPVVLYHAGVEALSGGFAGVDVFFVISGFLITRIIADAIVDRAFSIVTFYERRARRILPALFTVILVSIPLAWWTMVPYQTEDFAQSTVATALFASNFLFWYETDYFAVEAAAKPLLHTWSLAVEEQFYFVFPLILIVLFRIGHRSVLPIVALLALASFFASLTIGAARPSANFFLFPFRAWELLIGSMAAIWMMQRTVTPRLSVSALGLATLIAGFVFASETSWPGLLTLFPVVGTALLLLYAHTSHAVGKLLAWKPLRFLGLISYSLYLWHLPFLSFLHIHYFGEPPVILIASAIAMSLTLSVLTWRFVERPFRDPQQIRIGQLCLSITTVAFALLAFGWTGAQTAGFQRYAISKIPEAFAAQVIDRDAEVALRAPIWAAALSEANQPFSEVVGHKVLILGDSLSGDLFVATRTLTGAVSDPEFRRIRLDDRCMPTMLQALEAGIDKSAGGDRCTREVGNLIKSALLESADEVVLAANWQPETVIFGKELAHAIAGPNRTVSMLGVAAFNDMASLSLRLSELNEPLESFLYRNIRAKYQTVNDKLSALSTEAPHIRYLDKLRLFCNTETQTCDMIDEDGRLILFDSAHVTASGVAVLSDRIAQTGWFE